MNSVRKLRKVCLFMCAAVLLLAATAVSATAVEAPSLSAVGAIVIDGDSGEVLYEKNGYASRPAASMTKLVSLYLVYEEMAAGRMSFDTMVFISRKASDMSYNRAYSGFEQLKNGGAYRAGSLMEVIITASCNGAVVALAEHISGSESAFVERMNSKAAAWGVDARFADCTGFIDEGNAVSPYAMALIAKHLIDDYPDILRLSSLKSTTFQGKTFTTTNRLLRQDAYGGIDGLKTGNTNGAGRCFTGTALQNGRRVITVAMNCSSDNTRVADTRKLLDYGFARVAELDGARALSAAQTTLAVTAGEGYIYPQDSHRFDLVLSGVGEKYPCTLQWEVNGAPVERREDFWAENGKTVSLFHQVQPGGEILTVGARLLFRDGRELYREEKFPVSPQPLSLQARMGITAITLYPGSNLMIPVFLSCAQGVSLTVSAGWYMDGVPISGDSNAAFRLAPEGKSAYHLRVGESLPPGEHILSFVCNPDGKSGVGRIEFTTVICVLPTTEETVPEEEAEQIA